MIEHVSAITVFSPVENVSTQPFNSLMKLRLDVLYVQEPNVKLALQTTFVKIFSNVQTQVPKNQISWEVNVLVVQSKTA